MAIGHTRNHRGERQDLEDHLRAVAGMSARFAEPLGASEATRWLGLWHDIGKYHPRFQAYLETCDADPNHREYVDHKAAGAKLAAEHLGVRTGMVVQAHHGGLQDAVAFQAWLQERLATGEPETSIDLARAALADLEPAEAPTLPPWVEKATSEKEVELFLRLVFSALVDADSLDTEAHYFPQRPDVRSATASVAELRTRLESDHEALLAQTPADPVGTVRREVYEAAVEAASLPPGFFRLTVPTGGGKTRSGLAFALRHALEHGHERVIVAVPFLSITEQTAAVYRDIFAGLDDAAVLEHHSQAGSLDEESFDAASLWARLAAENWDAPVVVTTTVQLFESLFSNRRSDCRKLHRLARSVIVLDEAQALPSRLLRPIVDALTELTTRFRTSVVLSTATQPAFDVIPEFRRVEAREIAADPPALFRRLRRVRYEWRIEPALTWPEVAEEIRAEPHALAIVNTRADAHELLGLLDDPEALHLSTTLCGAHRRAVIAEVRRRLAADEPCRLVTTQVVEAGVDIDFPVVYRALAPLDAIIQAAGRCNREGRLREGRVVVFEPANGGLPGGLYRTATDKTRALIERGAIDPDDPDTALDYFRSLLVPPFTDTDQEGIQALRGRLDYPGVARAFRIIRTDSESLVVPYEPVISDGLVEQMRTKGADPRALWRSLQPYLVSIMARKAERHRASGLISPVSPGLGVWHGRYDAVLGLVEAMGPEDLLV
jgi:CRISPR-associated endonuclease/helicase Cas3